MAYFNWSADLSVGIAQIDQQHQKLVGFLNKLYEAMQAGKGQEALGETFTELVLYTKTHFAAEEQFMAVHKYPEYAAHKEKHAKMALKVKDLYEQFRQGTISSPIQITNFLKDWLGKHIKETDKKYGPYLIAKGLK